MADLRLGSMIIEDHGGGDAGAVVMVHGLGGSSGSFQPLMNAASGYRVLRPDLPGAGRSSLHPGRPGLDGLASAVRQSMHAANIKKAHFVGHSMGTIICQMIAADNPELVASMVLFGPLSEPPTAARHALKERGARARLEGMAGIADVISANSVAQTGDAAAIAFVRESLLRQDSAGYAAHCDALSDTKAARHEKINCPVTLVAGENDPVAPVAMAKDLSEKIAGARLEIIPNVAHWIMLEAAGRSSELLRTHLDTYDRERKT